MLSENALLIAEFTEKIKQFYGERLAKIILYGSYARGDFNAESDIDFLVLLNENEVKSSKEIWKLSSIIGDLSFKFDTLVSILPTSNNVFDSSKRLFFREVKKEGIVIYGNT